MHQWKRPSLIRLTTLILLSVVARTASAQDAPAPAPADAPAPPPRAWSNAGELAYVVTSGNSESSTLGFKDTLTWKKAPSQFELKLGGIRVESSVKSVAAGPVLQETTSTTAESYFLTGRYDHNAAPKFFWFAGGGWERNRFAGIDNRYVGFGGVGNIWHDSERLKFRTDYAFTLTRQEDVIVNPAADDTFAGLRFSWKYEHRFNAATTYGNDLVTDGNFEETSDWRGDMVNWLTVAMNRRLALKVSLRWLYDNEPSFDTITDGVNTLTYQLEELDTIFTTALVINI